MTEPAADAAVRSERLRLLDAWRGFSLLSMMAFHFCYDLKYLRGVDLAFFGGVLQTVWRCSISWSFLVLAGFVCVYSRSNLKRAGRYLAVATAIYVVTLLAAVDTPISFGIIFCMGVSTLIFALLDAVHLMRGSLVVSAALLVAFLLSQDVAAGVAGVPGLSMELPRGIYESGLVSWLGFPAPGFASGDYYPVIPYTFLFLSAASLSQWLRERQALPACVREWGCRPLEALGQQSLLVYVAHQPLLLALSLLFAG